MAGAPGAPLSSPVKGHSSLLPPFVPTSLSGYPPFSDKNARLSLREQIARGDYFYCAQLWQHVSKEAFDLVQKLLVVDPQKRLKIEEALAHPWLQSYLRRMWLGSLPARWCPAWDHVGGQQRVGGPQVGLVALPGRDECMKHTFQQLITQTKGSVPTPELPTRLLQGSIQCPRIFNINVKLLGEKIRDSDFVITDMQMTQNPHLSLSHLGVKGVFDLFCRSLDVALGRMREDKLKLDLGKNFCGLGRSGWHARGSGFPVNDQAWHLGMLLGSSEQPQAAAVATDALLQRQWSPSLGGMV
ncbi:Serine/threonine-protein kinase Chk2 [Varanus komodoensis]|nr:Serine/threonine-protein kinase Chk2 [Varanus komodoensis]